MAISLHQEDYAVSSFEVGQEYSAYVDVNRQFKIFHNGQTFIVEDFPPVLLRGGR